MVQLALIHWDPVHRSAGDCGQSLRSIGMNERILMQRAGRKQNGSMQPSFSCIFAVKQQRGIENEWLKETREWCCPLRFNKGILFYLCAYTRSTNAVRNTPMPCAHTNADTISCWLCSSFQSARPISAAGLVFGSFISHMGEQLCQCKEDLAQHSGSAKARYDKSAWHLSQYNTSAIKNYWSTSTSSSWFGADLVDQQCYAIYLQLMLVNKPWPFDEDSWPRKFC